MRQTVFHESCSIFITLMMLFNVAAFQSGDPATQEPICTSRFDFDYKVLSKLVALETAQSLMRETIRKQEDVIKEIRASASQTLEQHNSEIQTLLVKMNSVESIFSLGGSGTVYIRWGRTSCPGNGTELVYDGYAGGSHYSVTGGAADVLCLPNDPLWDVYEDSTQSGAYMYGAEYQFTHRERGKFFGTDPFDKDVPCAVCRTARSSVMLLPARNMCYDGWTLEYNGYLSAEHSDHAGASRFTCMDARPEVLMGGGKDENGRLFYFVEASCGSLRCPPYVNGRELTCAVCSK
ncbi:hypothetical protein MAR_029060 [Mya arenaria]|uniref:Short-chain collagen C4-like n=1 Tax=Mya arenaria TaxID=6604 RepID=A0ABY7DJ53_MYAAR|nr:uncharacterized protein LOC128224279 [Mya arenaria]WAQ96370.1 hypothetical protein MAR_029060 [Mya arenaria]